MSKHAMLIIAHNQFEILRLLMKQLDDTDNDLYIHVDKKAKHFKIEEFQTICIHSKVVFIPRRNVYWGHSSLVECELDLMRAALDSGEKYSYLHLLSGVDLQIKSNKEIHDFFDDNPNCQFLAERNFFSGINGLNRYYFFLPLRYYNKYLAKGLDILSEFVQRKILHINRLKEFHGFLAKAQQWFSITPEFAAYVLTQEKFIHQFIRHTCCSDEMFLATVLVNSPYSNQWYKKMDRRWNHMRLIDRDRNEGASPHTWRMEDWHWIVSCPLFWARKFDLKTDKEVIDKVFELWH